MTSPFTAGTCDGDGGAYLFRRLMFSGLKTSRWDALPLAMTSSLCTDSTTALKEDNREDEKDRVKKENREDENDRIDIIGLTDVKNWLTCYHGFIFVTNKQKAHVNTNI